MYLRPSLFNSLRIFIIWIFLPPLFLKTKRKGRKKKEERKFRKALLTNFSNFLLFNPVLQPSGVPGESQLVLTDGWDGWMGWMDGLVRTCFCSAYCSKTTWYMTLIVSMPLRRRFKTSFVKKSEFFKKLFFLKKFRTKQKISNKTGVFRDQILKRIPIFLD